MMPMPVDEALHFLPFLRITATAEYRGQLYALEVLRLKHFLLPPLGKAGGYAPGKHAGGSHLSVN
jgi:hypothetical protein